VILITGGMGFIGLHTARCFLDAGEKVLLTQFRARREPDFIRDEIGRGVTVETLDVADGAAVHSLVRRYDVDGIVHLAVPGLGRLEPSEEHRTNLFGLFNVLEAAREAGVRRVSLASSVAIYSGVAEGPCREEAPLRMEADNSTEAFKKVFEVAGLFYGRQTGLDVVALRIGGIYGPLYHSMANLPSRLTHAAVRGNEPDLTGGRGGVPHEEDASDLCYVKDCARGIQLVHSAERLSHRIYSIGGGRATTVRELVDAVQAAVPGIRFDVAPGKGAAYRPNAYMDLSRARADAGYEPQYDVQTAIADYVDWLQCNPE
jgi:UDP-glucose 4-epimerase